MNILETNKISKTYRKRKVINNVSLHMKQGEIYGFVGPNGSGKSTFLKIILNLVTPDNGYVKLFDKKMNSSHTYKLLSDIGSIIEYPYFYTKLTGRENLQLHCEYMKIPALTKIDDVLELLKIEDAADKVVESYSVGMKQRLAIARAIISNPSVLILDEPLNGLDPEGIVEVRNLILDLKKERKMSILISSHILSEMELIADTIGIIKNGKLLTETSMEEIHKKIGKYRKLEVDNTQKAKILLEDTMGIKNIQILNNKEIYIYNSLVNGKEISKVLVENGVGLEKLEVCEQSLEDYFFEVINRRKGG